MIEKPTQPKIYTPQDGSCVLNLDARDIRGSKIYDRSGEGNHGAITGATRKPGNYGLPALDFDGVDDIVDCGNDGNLNEILDNLSIECWLYLNGWGESSSGRIMSKRGVGGNIELTVNENVLGGVKGMIFIINSGTYLSSNNALELGKWINVVFTFDSSLVSDNYKFYIDGEPFSSGNKADPISTNTNNFLIGGNAATDRSFNGKIDMFKFWKRVLTSSEISQLYNNIKHLYGR